MPRGLDPLHGEIGALDDAELDGRSAALASRHRPLRERALHAERLGQVSLEHHARRQRKELRLVEHLAEGRHGEIEIAMLFHIEVDELGHAPPIGTLVVVTQGLPVEDAEPILDAPHGVAEGDEIDLAEPRAGHGSPPLPRNGLRNRAAEAGGSSS